MTGLAQLYLPGAVPLWCALFFSLAAMWGYAKALRSDGGLDTDSVRFARRGYGFYAFSVLCTAAVLLLCLWRRDYRIEYVYQYSGNDLAGHFQMAAFWAGQKGSFLIWLVWGAVIGLLVRRTAGRDEPTVMIVYMLTQFGLLFILLRENPFVMLTQTPADGAGLNPLLQDDWMVIHPPVMFIGYALAAVPFAFAVAAMWRGDTSRWAIRVFPWALAGFLILGTAILMGGYWAYKTLGWGGYWGWDPVENASLIPWLLGVVLIHGLYLERSRQRYRRLNLVIACLLFMSVLYGTFLTRSGVLADFSVHSFVDLGLSAWLVGLLGFFGLLSAGLLAYRLPKVKTEKNIDPLISRGTLLVMSTIIVGLSTVAVTFGTSAPLLTGWFMEQPGQVGPEWYNAVHLPLALMTAAFLIIVPFVTWRQRSGKDLLKKLIPCFLFGLVGVAIAVVAGVREPVNLLYLFLGVSALGANIAKTAQLVQAGGLGSAGGYLSHVGVGIMLVGVMASSAYDHSMKVTLPQGVPTQISGDLTLTFNRVLPREGRMKERMEVDVQRADGFSYTAYPKLFVNDRTRQLMVNPHIRKTMLQDYYLSPIMYEPAQPAIDRRRVQLSKGDRRRVGDLEVRFVDFVATDGKDPMIRLAAGEQVELGVRLAIDRNGQQQEIVSRYRFDQNGAVDTPFEQMPGGGVIAVTGVAPVIGQIQLDLQGLGQPPMPPRLSLDVTRKPLISMVWYGLYVVLAGGFLSTFKRLRASRKLDRPVVAT